MRKNKFTTHNGSNDDLIATSLYHKPIITEFGEVTGIDPNPMVSIAIAPKYDPISDFKVIALTIDETRKLISSLQELVNASTAVGK